MWEKMKQAWGEKRRERIIEQRGVKTGCCSKLGVQFAWLHSAGDFNYFSASMPLLVMSCMLRSPASDYRAFVRASARCQAVITFALESITARQKAYKAIIQVLSFSMGLNCTVWRNSKVKTRPHKQIVLNNVISGFICVIICAPIDSLEVRVNS